MIRFGVVMDDIAKINYKKDSTLAMLWEAQDRHYEIYYLTLHDLLMQDGIPYGKARRLKVFKNNAKWYELSQIEVIALSDLTMIFMRKDPPFDEEYLYATYILEHAERLGSLVVNRPQSLRDANEKFFATLFPAFCPPTLISSSIETITAFWQEQKDIVCKPLNGMGGVSVFRLQEHEVNANVIFSSLTQQETKYIMAQRFIPEIKTGDKRIILIDGEVFPHTLARVPQGKEWRGNLAVGAKGIVQELTIRDKEIAKAIGPTLKEKGLFFVGIDVIGNFLTEINVTSPTGIRELDAELNCNISAMLMDALEKKLKVRTV